MKALILSICLTSFLFADEPEEVVVEELKIDPLLAVKEEFSKARKKGWDFSAEKKKTELPKKSNDIGLGFSVNPPNYHPMQKSEMMMQAFRSDMSELERGRQMDRLNELDHTYKHPGRRNNSR